MDNPIWELRPDSLDELRSREFVLEDVADCDEVRRHVEKEVRSYVRVESAACSAKGLQFVRSAWVDGVAYLLWQTPDDEFVTFEFFEDQVTLSLGCRDGLTAEQFLVRTYLSSQWQLRLS